MSRNQFFVLMVITALIMSALFTNWFVRQWIADTCTQQHRIKLDARLFECNIEQ